MSEKLIIHQCEIAPDSVRIVASGLTEVPAHINGEPVYDEHGNQKTMFQQQESIPVVFGPEHDTEEKRVAHLKKAWRDRMPEVLAAIRAEITESRQQQHAGEREREQLETERESLRNTLGQVNADMVRETTKRRQLENDNGILRDQVRALDKLCRDNGLDPSQPGGGRRGAGA